MDTLHFTPQTVKELEDEAKQPFTMLIGNYSVTNLALFIKHGLGIEEPETFRIIEDYLKDKTLENLQLLVMKKLQAGGFLSRSLNLEDMEKTMEANIKKAASGSGSVSIGNLEKKTQS